MAIFYAFPGSQGTKATAAVLFGLFLPVVFLNFRSFWKGLVVCLLVYPLFAGWWLTIEPTNNKDWAPDVARISSSVVSDDRLVLRNVRNFSYSSETDFAQIWEDREYDLSKLNSLDIFLSYWASEHIAHTIMSWGFEDGQYLAISIETRKDKTQEFSAFKGFFKQFMLSYIAADENDIIKLRTNHLKERVYVYRIVESKERIRALLDQYLKKMNSLVHQPEFYNALTQNCTTTIQLNANEINPDSPPPLDWRLIASGHVDELLYDRKKLRNDIPFTELRNDSRIDLRMQKYVGSDYSQALRREAPKFSN